jgi:hypothetical protein
MSYTWSNGNGTGSCAPVFGFVPIKDTVLLSGNEQLILVPVVFSSRLFRGLNLQYTFTFPWVPSFGGAGEAVDGFVEADYGSFSYRFFGL